MGAGLSRPLTPGTLGGVIEPDWIPHRRSTDRELVGWVRPAGEEWVAVSLFGSEITGEVDWTEAEEALENTSLAWMAEVWMLERADKPALRVRIVEFSPDRIVDGAVEPGRIVVKTDDFGAIDAPTEQITLAWPPRGALRPPRPGEAASPWGDPRLRRPLFR